MHNSLSCNGHILTSELWSEGCICIMSGELKFNRWVICQNWCLKYGASGVESVTEVMMVIAASRRCTRGQPTPTRSTVWRRWAATSSASLPAMMPGTGHTRTPSASPPPRHRHQRLKVLPSFPWSWSVLGVLEFYFSSVPVLWICGFLHSVCPPSSRTVSWNESYWGKSSVAVYGGKNDVTEYAGKKIML